MHTYNLIYNFFMENKMSKKTAQKTKTTNTVNKVNSSIEKEIQDIIADTKKLKDVNFKHALEDAITKIASNEKQVKVIEEKIAKPRQQIEQLALRSSQALIWALKDTVDENFKINNNVKKEVREKLDAITNPASRKRLMRAAAGQKIQQLIQDCETKDDVVNVLSENKLTDQKKLISYNTTKQEVNISKDVKNLVQRMENCKNEKQKDGTTIDILACISEDTLSKIFENIEISIQKALDKNK